MRRKIQWVTIVGLGLCLSAVSMGPAWAKESAVALAQAPASVSAEVGPICSLIYQGQFEKAESLVKKTEQQGQAAPSVLALQGLISRYESIVQQRKDSRGKAFADQLAKLKKLEKGESLDVNELGVADPTDPNQKEDKVLTTLSVVTQGTEFADQQQRQAMLSDPYVKGMIQKAVDRATQYESEGKWLEAYTECYAWLKAMDPNNEGYKKYADDLWDKVLIASSFEDSPCETSRERYEGVREEIFERVIRQLNLYYVRNIDYGEMATACLDRCRQLAEVLAVRRLDPNDTVTYDPPLPDQVKAWTAELAAWQAKIKQDPTGLTMNQFLGKFDDILKLNAQTDEQDFVVSRVVSVVY